MILSMKMNDMHAVNDFILHVSRRERALLRKIYYLERSIAYYGHQPLHPYRLDNERISYIDRELDRLVGIGNAYVRYLDSLGYLLSFSDLNSLEDDTDFEDFESDPEDLPEPSLNRENGVYRTPRRIT